MDLTNKRERQGEPVRLAGAALGDRAHICAFVNNEDAYRLLLPLLKDGLENGEKAVQTVDPQRREEYAGATFFSGDRCQRTGSARSIRTPRLASDTSW